MSEYPVISEEAKEAAEKEVNRWRVTHTGGAITLGEFVQPAITAATEKLTKENEELRHELADLKANNRYQRGYHAGEESIRPQIQTLSARVKELEAENKKMFEL